MWHHPYFLSKNTILCRRCSMPWSSSSSLIILITSTIFFSSFFKYRYILFLILQAEYCNADRITWKLTLQDIKTTPKELKTERDCSHRQQFRYYCSSSIWRNNRRKLWCKISAHSDLALTQNSKHPQNHAISRWRSKSPSVKLVSRRENKEELQE